MTESPKAFREHDEKSDRYIHRFSRRTADSGLSFEPMCETVYAQLDKAKNQLCSGNNGEGDDRLQVLLAAMKDVNEPIVRNRMEKDCEFSKIIRELEKLSRNKEVQIMMLAEKYAAMDIASMRAEERAEGRAEERADTFERVTQNYMKREGITRTEAEEKAKAILQ